MDLDSTFCHGVATVDSRGQRTPEKYLAVIRAAHRSESWAGLARVWSTLGTDLWRLLPESKDIFAAISDEVVRTRYCLRESRDSARAVVNRVDEEVNFDVLVLPRQPRYASDSFFVGDIDAEALLQWGSADDVVTGAVHALRRIREFGSPQTALDLSGRVLGRLEEFEDLGDVPTPRNRARVLLEAGRIEFAVGHVSRAAVLLSEAQKIAVSGLMLRSPLRANCIAWNEYVRLSAGFGGVDARASSRDTDAGDRDEDLQRALPSALMVEALRALDRLDLDSDCFDKLAGVSASAAADLAANATVLMVQRDLLSGNQARAILTLDRYMGEHEQFLSEAPKLANAVLSCRIQTLLHAGQAHRASISVTAALRGRVKQNSPDVIRLSLATGDHERVINLANSAREDSRIGLREKIAASALKAVSLLAIDAREHACQEFRTALRYSSMAKSLLAVACLPVALRDELVRATEEAPEWDEISSALDIERDLVRARVVACASHSADLTLPLLKPRELQLLAHLDAAQSVGEIAQSMSVAVGTARNNLSALYRTLGVTGWKPALAYGYRHGILPVSRY